MIPDFFSRFELLVGREALETLQNSTVAVFGLGGVGSFAAEALARAGVGGLVLVDGDLISETNINRQLLAAHSTVGKPKAELMRDRVADINPDARVTAHYCFFSEETAGRFDFAAFDYVVDAIDTVSSKLALIHWAQSAGTPIISAMGAGNSLDPTRFEVADIYETSVCPLARVMRHELRHRGVRALKVVYSKEPLAEPVSKTDAFCPPGPDEKSFSRPVVGSASFVPPVAGFILGGEVIRDLIGMPR